MVKRARLQMLLGQLALFIALLVFSGCAPQTQYGAAKITSAPEGAEVVNLKDSSHLGVTPVNVFFPGEKGTAEFVTIQLHKPGYISRITSFWINRRHKSHAEAEDNAVDIILELEKKLGQ